MKPISKNHCLVCKGGRKNSCLYWHLDAETGLPWTYCTGVCQRGYSLQQYCDTAGIDVDKFIAGGIEVAQEMDNEVQAMAWPARFISLADPRAKDGVDYIKSRGLTLDGDMYYDIEDRGIVQPLYYHQHFVGAQVRFLEPRIRDNDNVWKVTTLQGTRLKLLFGMWNQSKLMPHVKGIIVCEGFFNSLSLQQALNLTYGSISTNPWRCVCTSGCSVSQHHIETLKGLKEAGYKVVGAFDADEAGIAGTKKMIAGECLTHYACTGDTETDLNDILKREGHAGLAKIFLEGIRKI